MTKKQKHEYAVKKAVSVVTANNPINIFQLGDLEDALRAMEIGELALLIASDYSPEGATPWQDIIAAQGCI